MAKNCLIFKNFERPNKEGRYHRLVCLTGEKKGETYYLVGPRIIIGRSKTVEITIIDNKASREHAELTKVDDHYIITDLGSQNGVIINELKITQEKLVNNDNIIIGKTVYKYNIIDIKKEMIPAASRAAEIKEEYKPEPVKSRKESDSEEVAQKAKKKRIYIIAAVLVLLLLFMDPDEESKSPGQTDKKSTSTTNNANQEQAYGKETVLAPNIKNILKRGLREEREGNYYRAIAEYNHAISLSSKGNARASFYLRRARQKLDEEIDNTFVRAQKQFSALRYRSAANEYCLIMRMLQNTPKDERFANAESNVKEVERQLGLEEGEINCLE